MVSTGAPSVLRGRLPLAVGLLLAVPYLPLLATHARQLWLRPHYQFFPLLLACAACLAAARVRGAGPFEPGSRRGCYLLLGGSGGLLALALLCHSPWLGAVAALVLAVGVAFGLGGGVLLRRLLPAWVLLWLAVPPPLDLDRGLILALQQWTTAWSSAVLDVLGVHHVRSGNVLEVAGRRLLVEEACSGVRSLFAVLACTLFFVLWARRPPLRAVLLLGAAFAWVLAANVARVAGIAYVSTQLGWDLTTGWQHEAFGTALFAATLGLIWNTDRLLLFFAARGDGRRGEGRRERGEEVAKGEGQEERDEKRGTKGEGQEASTQYSVLSTPCPAPAPSFRAPSFCSWPVILGYTALAVAQLWLWQPATAEASPGAGLDLTRLEALAEDALPARQGSWQRLAFETERRDLANPFGEFSRIWRYRAGAANAAAAVDYPFAGWHELTVCYTVQGWSLLDRGVVRDSADGFPFVEARLARPLDRHGYLLFCLCDGQGRPLEPTRESVGERLLDRVKPSLGAVPAYQFQLFVESYAPLTPAEETQARSFFRQVHRLLTPGS